jgi:tRNA-uridine 2-sulfurtransferase
MNKNRVVIGMSGGVDSSVAAALLLEAGYEVIGVTMQIWPEQDSDKTEKEGGCCSLSAVDDARRVANKLGIPYYVMNFKDIFEKKVVDYFIKEYTQGKTPNPCIACNRYVKFEELLKRSLALDSFYVATGHYAKITYDQDLKRYLIKKSVTAAKDQTYALYNMSQFQLEHTLMPLGDYTKEQTRAMAEQLEMDVASKPDSQEICFVENDDYGNFINQRVPGTIKPGNFVDIKGNILGVHKGIAHYTIGQRKGLGIALGWPAYVVDIRPHSNTVVLGTGDEVFGKALIAGDLNYIPFDKLEAPLEVNAKIRYSAKEAPALLIPQQDGQVKVEFVTPQRAITPGQSIVFYKEDIVVGGGIITHPIF